MRWVLFVVAVVWIGGCLAGDYYLFAKPLMFEWRARTFTPVLAKIVSSQLQSSGDSTIAVVQFEYVAGGSTRHAEVRDKLLPPDDTVTQYPAGAAATAYYDPANPATAVLERGPSRNMAVIALFFTLFNLASVFLCICVVRCTFVPRGMGFIGTYRVRPDGDRPGAELFTWPWWVIVGCFVAGASFVVVFVSVVSTLARMVPLWAVPVVWLIGVVGGAFFAVRWRRRRGPEGDWLIVDRRAGTLQLPHAKPWVPPQVVPIGAVRSVKAESVRETSSDGVSVNNQVRIVIAGGQSRSIRPFPKQHQAEAFAAWLSDALGLVAAAAEHTEKPA